MRFINSAILWLLVNSVIVECGKNMTIKEHSAKPVVTIDVKLAKLEQMTNANIDKLNSIEKSATKSLKSLIVRVKDQSSSLIALNKSKASKAELEAIRKAEEAQIRVLRANLTKLPTFGKQVEEVKRNHEAMKNVVSQNVTLLWKALAHVQIRLTSALNKLQKAHTQKLVDNAKKISSLVKQIASLNKTAAYGDVSIVRKALEALPKDMTQFKNNGSAQYTMNTLEKSMSVFGKHPKRVDFQLLVYGCALLILFLAVITLFFANLHFHRKYRKLSREYLSFSQFVNLNTVDKY